jgi:hypothetical protein
LLRSGALRDWGVCLAFQQPCAAELLTAGGKMLSIHLQARTTPAVREEIASSHEPMGVLAQRYGVSTETIRTWRKRGVQDCQGRSSRPHKLP